MERDPTQTYEADTKRLMDLESDQAGAMKITPGNLHIGYEGTTTWVELNSLFQSKHVSNVSAKIEWTLFSLPSETE